MFVSISISIASIILAILALSLPIISVHLMNHNKNCNHILLTLFSVSSCSASIFIQILYFNYLVKSEDWSSLLDTSGAITVISFIFLITTIILNFFSLTLYSKSNK